jgi:hypothetical protein
MNICHSFFKFVICFFNIFKSVGDMETRSVCSYTEKEGCMLRSMLSYEEVAVLLTYFITI